jgi:hypothetical protein
MMPIFLSTRGISEGFGASSRNLEITIRGLLMHAETATGHLRAGGLSSGREVRASPPV